MVANGSAVDLPGLLALQRTEGPSGAFAVVVFEGNHMVGFIQREGHSVTYTRYDELKFRYPACRLRSDSITVRYLKKIADRLPDHCQMLLLRPTANPHIDAQTQLARTHEELVRSETFRQSAALTLLSAQNTPSVPIDL